MTEVQQTLS